jgi:hypothetical protein
MHKTDTRSPYAPPQSSILSDTASNKSAHRPASSKWAFFILAASAIGIAILEYQFISERGWSAWFDHPMSIVQNVIRLIALTGLAAKCQRPWVYWTTIIILIWHLANSTMTLLDLPKGSRIALDTASAAMLWLFSALLVYHFYRFAFGLHSRQYYGVNQRAEGSEPS